MDTIQIELHARLIQSEMLSVATSHSRVINWGTTHSDSLITLSFSLHFQLTFYELTFGYVYHIFYYKLSPFSVLGIQLCLKKFCLTQPHILFVFNIYSEVYFTLDFQNSNDLMFSYHLIVFREREIRRQLQVIDKVSPSLNNFINR